MTAFAQAAEFTVSKDGRGAFNTIQAAVDKAGSYDVVTILDADVYAEQVTLQAPLHHFTLRSANPTALSKPVIRWADKENVGPRTCAESLVPENITFERNGALRLIGVRDIRIEGVAVEGIAPAPFAYPKVWSSVSGSCLGFMSTLFHGNAGIVILRSAHTVVRDCDISGAYFGVHIKDGDLRGPFMVRRDAAAPPFSLMALGNHLLEGNSIHHNSWGVSMENAWGLGSTFRNNLIYHNHHRAGEAASVHAMVDGSNQPGGAFLFKEAQHSSMAIHNNTFAENYLVMAGHYRPGAQHLVVNNIFAKPNVHWSDSAAQPFGPPFHELSPYFPRRMKHDVFASFLQEPPLRSQQMTASLYDSASGKYVSVDTSIRYFYGVRMINGLPYPVTSTMEVEISVPLTSGPVPVRRSIENVQAPGALLLKADSYAHFNEEDGMRWLETGFLSDSSADSGFLSPDSASERFLRKGWPTLGYRAAQDKDPGIGALPRKKRPVSLRVAPLAPALMEEGQLVLRFALSDPGNPGITGVPASAVSYLGLIQGVPASENAFGGQKDIVLRTEPQLPIVPSTPLRYGYNEIRIPAAGLKLDAAGAGFVEMAVKGTDAFGNIATFPVLPGSDSLRVELMDELEDRPVTGVPKGGTLRVRVTRLQSPADSTLIVLFTASGADMELLDNPEKDSAGYFVARPSFTVKVRLNEIPEGGSELICATDARRSSKILTGFGVSKPLAIMASPNAVHTRPNRVASKPDYSRKFRNLLGRKHPRPLNRPGFAVPAR